MDGFADDANAVVVDMLVPAPVFNKTPSKLRGEHVLSHRLAVTTSSFPS
jgi:hypothetical protein